MKRVVLYLAVFCIIFGFITETNAQNLPQKKQREICMTHSLSIVAVKALEEKGFVVRQDVNKMVTDYYHITSWQLREIQNQARLNGWYFCTELTLENYAHLVYSIRSIPPISTTRKIIGFTDYEKYSISELILIIREVFTDDNQEYSKLLNVLASKTYNMTAQEITDLTDFYCYYLGVRIIAAGITGVLIGDQMTMGDARNMAEGILESSKLYDHFFTDCRQEAIRRLEKNLFSNLSVDVIGSGVILCFWRCKSSKPLIERAIRFHQNEEVRNTLIHFKSLLD